jgi:hypothetical protein
MEHRPVAPPSDESPTADPAEVGSWEPVRWQFDYLPVHIALLPTGKVLGISGSGNERRFLEHPHSSQLWDPASGAIVNVDQQLDGDLFCCGHTFLADGRLLVAGGTSSYETKHFGYPIPPFGGLRQSYLYDPFANAWTRTPDMLLGRWYPTLVLLADGRALAVAGFTESFPWVVRRNLEVFTPGQGWATFTGAERWLPLYPRLHLLPDGNVLYAGSYNTHYSFPFDLRAFPTGILEVNTRSWRTIGPPHQSEREEGISVLLPLEPPDYRARVLLAGGGTPQGTESSADAEVIDPCDPAPAWRTIAPMKHARYFAYPVILPDGKVIVIGGRGGEKMHMSMDDGPPMSPPPHDPLAVMEPELFDPATETWRPLASMAVDRLYHSNALLLPDGRVATFGSNPATGMAELRIEIYDPPYLFKGSRPRIEAAPKEATRGGEIEIATPDALTIEAVVLIRPGVTTHCVNADQRYVGLEIIARQADRLRSRLPTQPGVAPSGYYLLFIVRAGVPSEATFVQVT